MGSTCSRCAPILSSVDERRSDAECWSQAWQYLMSLLGSAPDALHWDEKHHLQGHAQVKGHELVVIASRDQDHHVLVLTPEDWDEIRRAPAQDRGELLRRCAIDDHDRLLRVLADA
jgi:hypothetical protein